jgi:hypothetical protein
MDELEVEFDYLFKEEGGLYGNAISKGPIFAIVVIYAKQLLSSLVNQGTDKISVYVDIIDNNSLNASIKKEGDYYFIGIYRGIIDLLINIFFRMLSNKNVLQEIGDVGKENGIEKIFDAQVTNVEHLQNEFTEHMMPRDKERCMMAHVYILEVVEFLVLHEFAHIIGGHLDYSKSSFNSLVIDFREEGEEDAALIFQAFEVFADDFAIRTKLNILNGVDGNDFIMRPIKHQEWPTIIKQWLFPMYTFFRLFGHTNSQYSLKDDLHPPPAARFNMILNNLGYCLESKFGFSDSEKLREVFLATMMEVECAFDEISEQGLDLRPMHFSFKDNITAHVKKLLDLELVVARAFADK